MTTYNMLLTIMHLIDPASKAISDIDKKTAAIRIEIQGLQREYRKIDETAPLSSDRTDRLQSLFARMQEQQARYRALRELRQAYLDAQTESDSLTAQQDKENTHHLASSLPFASTATTSPLPLTDSKLTNN